MTLPASAHDTPLYQGVFKKWDRLLHVWSDGTTLPVIAGGSVDTAPDEPSLLVRVEEFARLASIGRTKAFAIVGSGEIESVLIGSSRRIPRAAVDAYIERLRTEAKA